MGIGIRGWLCGVLCVALIAPVAVAAPPNFVVVMADDLGYGDLGCYGNTEIRTPQLDRMAAEGTRLDNFYSSAPSCTPSRAGLLTGRYSARMGLERVLFPKDTKGFPKDETTIAELLKPLGYATACIGKWHIGHAPENLPQAHGFDYYFGIPYSNDMAVKERGDPPTPLMRNSEIVEQPAEQSTLTLRYTDEAIQFIRQHRDRPFFVYLPHTMPHVPLFASEAFLGKSKRGLYGDVIEEMDANMGRLLDALRAEGLAENTLVIFTSDNGPWLIKKEDGGTAGPLRDGKGTVFEGGMRVPFLAWWPGKVPAGRVVSAASMNIDLLPSLAALAGAALPAGKPLDGRDVSGVWLGNGAGEERRLFYQSGPKAWAYREGDWKLILPGGGGPALKPIKDAPALFNLAADPGETTDVAGEHPERVQQMVAALAAHNAAVEAERGALPESQR